ncbi:MAG: hypothetical protein NT145_01215 [Elusimicrobia bacterium]|nr:hypothetical protein [Elusimicrobiota bacterium]
MSVENLPIDVAVIGQQVRVKASAKIPSVKPGVLDLNLNFNSLAPKYNFAGEFKATDIYVPYFSPFLKGNDEIILKNGTLEIRSNVNCTENWITASNMITLNRLSMESTSKKIFGIPKDVATQFFEANNVAFDLPINGDIFKLKIDFKTASTQVMYKALQGRFKSESFTRRVAESFGERIGEKLQELFSKFL